MNCSGKHAGMIGTSVHNGWPVESYRDPDHPVQLAILQTIDDLAGEQAGNLAVDGCGAPLYSSTPAGLARATARIATAAPDTAEGRVADALRAHPWWVAGTGRDEPRFVAAVPGLIAKVGAEGVFTAALPDGRGVVVKVLDGSSRPLAPVVAAVLRALGAAGPALDAAGHVPVLGHGVPVGAVEPLVGRPAPA